MVDDDGRRWLWTMTVEDDVKTVWPLHASMEQAQHRVPFAYNGETARHIVRR